MNCLFPWERNLLQRDKWWDLALQVTWNEVRVRWIALISQPSFIYQKKEMMPHIKTCSVLVRLSPVPVPIGPHLFLPPHPTNRSSLQTLSFRFTVPLQMSLGSHLTLKAEKISNLTETLLTSM